MGVIGVTMGAYDATPDIFQLKLENYGDAGNQSHKNLSVGTNTTVVWNLDNI